MEFVTAINADISLQSAGFPRAMTDVWAKQQDNETRKIAVTIQENGEDWTIPAGASAEIRVQRPDKVLVTADCTISSPVVTATLTNEMLFVAGEALAEIRITNSSEVLSSTSIALHIKPCAVGGEHEGYVADPVNITSLTQSAYNNIETHNTNTLYICRDTGNAYIGDQIIAGGEVIPQVLTTEADYEEMASHDSGTLYYIPEATT